MLRSSLGFDWKKSSAHMLFLSKFRTPRTIEDFTKTESWKEVLKEDPRKAIKRFHDEGMIESADLSARLGYKYKVSELKDLLKERELSVSGRKADLIERLLEADPGNMRKSVKNLNLLQCTDNGHVLVEKYLNFEKEKRTQMELKALNALHRHKFKQASQTVASFEAKQVFPRGIGMDWKNYDTTGDVKVLRTIFKRKPKTLANLTDKQLEPIRIAAGMFHLVWNRGEVVNWLANKTVPSMEISGDSAALMLHSHAIFLREIDEFREVGIKSIMVNTCNDNFVCVACQKLAKKKHKTDKVPELPYEKCTSEGGCRCGVIAADW